MLTEAAREPVPPGVKATLIEQFALAARLLPQVEVLPKSPEFVPVMLIELIVREAFPVLLRVIDRDELESSKGLIPKVDAACRKIHNRCEDHPGAGQAYALWTIAGIVRNLHRGRF